MSAIPTYIQAEWPLLRHWPTDIGPLPTMNNIGHARMLVRRGTAVHMALAMFMRDVGATDDEAAAAASLATNARSRTHHNKRNDLVEAGVLRRIDLEKRNGKLAVRVELT